MTTAHFLLLRAGASLLPGWREGEGGKPYNGLCGEVSPFFRLGVYNRVGTSPVEV